MKKCSIVFVIIAAILGIVIFKYCGNGYNLMFNDGTINCKVKFKGIKQGKDFVIDNKKNYYIAFSNSIQIIEESGKSYNILKDNNLDICSIDIYEGKLYFISKTSLCCYDLVKKSLNIIRDDLPNIGDYTKSILRFYKDNLYITLGACTNSGVVGQDNKWLKSKVYAHDFYPYNINLTGVSFGIEGTGAFVSYNTKNYEGQLISSHFPGNASIIQIDLKNNKSETYAYGIRNIKGMDFDSKGKLIATVGGMEDRGLRPIKNDFDYIYEINRGVWYGWPDYSGGDGVNSPRFNNLPFVLEKHPSINPPAPIYQHSFLNSLGALAIDKNGIISEKDSAFFYDEKKNSIIELSKQGKLKDTFGLVNNKVVSIKFSDTSLVVLDDRGYIMEISKIVPTEDGKSKKFLYTIITIILIGIIYIIRVIIINKK